MAYQYNCICSSEWSGFSGKVQKCRNCGAKVTPVEIEDAYSTEDEPQSDTKPYQYNCTSCFSEWHGTSGTAQKCRNCRTKVTPVEIEDAYSTEGESQSPSTESQPTKMSFQYRCDPCNREWWGATGDAQMCYNCHKTRAPLPFEDMKGLGTFNCDCGNTFTGYISGRDTSRCYKCQDMVTPSEIYSLVRKGNRRTDNSHSCSVCEGREKTFECPNVPRDDSQRIATRKGQKTKCHK